MILYPNRFKQAGFSPRNTIHSVFCLIITVIRKIDAKNTPNRPVVKNRFSRKYAQIGPGLAFLAWVMR
jgi:4-hydroxybenzoate polyprenyltransferase